MALPFDHMFDPYNAERLRAAETMVVGATSYLGLQSYWPAIADNPDAVPAEREVSRLLNAIPKLVVSDSLPDAPEGPWQGTAEVVRRADAHKRIDEVNAKPPGTWWSSPATCSGTTCSRPAWSTNCT